MNVLIYLHSKLFIILVQIIKFVQEIWNLFEYIHICFTLVVTNPICIDISAVLINLFKSCTVIIILTKINMYI